MGQKCQIIKLGVLRNSFGKYRWAVRVFNGRLNTINQHSVFENVLHKIRVKRTLAEDNRQYL